MCSEDVWSCGGNEARSVTRMLSDDPVEILPSKRSQFLQGLSETEGRGNARIRDMAVKES